MNRTFAGGAILGRVLRVPVVVFLVGTALRAEGAPRGSADLERLVRGLIAAATTAADDPEGWFHYEWPVPEGLLPRWKSTCVRLVSAPSGASYVVSSGMYDDRMERGFVVHAVRDAGKQAYVRKARSGQHTYVVGSGIYVE